MSATEIAIRPSSIGVFLDCERRFAAHHLTELVRDAGYTVASGRQSHVGAIVGSGLHAVAEFTLHAKIANGLLGADADAEECGIEAARERAAAEGCEFDDATPSFDTAQKQLRRMARSWRRHLAPEIEPLNVEERIEANLGDGFHLTGQPDIVSTAPVTTIRDLKTNRVRRAPHAQLGAYGLMVQAHGHDVKRLVQDHVPRLPLREEQPAPSIIEADTHAAMVDAHEALMAIKRSVAEFQKRAADPHGAPPPSVWKPNPSSSLCSPKWCRAFATDLCPVHRGQA